MLLTRIDRWFIASDEVEIGQRQQAEVYLCGGASRSFSILAKSCLSHNSHSRCIYASCVALAMHDTARMSRCQPATLLPPVRPAKLQSRVMENKPFLMPPTLRSNRLEVSKIDMFS